MDQTVIYRIEASDEEHIGLAHSYHSLALSCADQGNYDRAIEFYEKSLSLKLKLLDDGAPSITRTYSNLGVVYKDKGEFDIALITMSSL